MLCQEGGLRVTSQTDASDADAAVSGGGLRERPRGHRPRR